MPAWTQHLVDALNRDGLVTDGGSDVQSYGIDGASLRAWRFAYAKARNGEGRANVVLYGDSVVGGYRSTSPQYSSAWGTRLRTVLAERTGVATGTGYIKPLAKEQDAGEDRYAFSTGTWVNRGGGPGFANTDRGNSAAGTLTIGPITTDRIRVHFLKYSGAGTATTTMDGVPAASIAGNQASGFTPAFQDFEVSQGSHTLVITAPASTDFDLLGIEASLNGTLSGVAVHNVGHNGQTAANLGTVSDTTLVGSRSQLAWEVLDPDLAMICFGLNELNTSVTPAAYKTQMQRVTAKAKAVGASVVLLTPPPPASGNDPLSNYANYVAALRELADSEGVALLDLGARWGTYALANAAGVMFDGQHPNGRGHWDMAEHVVEALHI